MKQSGFWRNEIPLAADSSWAPTVPDSNTWRLPHAALTASNPPEQRERKNQKKCQHFKSGGCRDLQCLSKTHSSEADVSAPADIRCGGANRGRQRPRRDTKVGAAELSHDAIEKWELNQDRPSKVSSRDLRHILSLPNHVGRHIQTTVPRHVRVRWQ